MKPFVYLLTITVSIPFAFAQFEFSGISPTIIRTALKTKKFLENEKTECMDDFRYVMEQAGKSEIWAARILDASAKLNSGYLRGNFAHLGDYNECLGASQKVNDTVIKGKYCLCRTKLASNESKVMVQKLRHHYSKLLQHDIENIPELEFVANDLSMSIGICVPISCNASYLTYIINSISPIDSVNHSVSEENCYYDGKEREHSTGYYITLTIIGMLLVMMISSTAYDLLVYQKTKDDKTVNLLIAFSVYSNGKQIFTRRKIQSTSCLNGMRVISMWWIIVGHKLQTTTSSTLMNYMDYLEEIKSWKYVHLTVAPLAVDTFFVITGFLVVLLFLRNREKKVRFSLPLYYLHRYLRLTPSIAFTILIATFVFRDLIQYNPILKFRTKYFFADKLNACRDYWWSTLLYIQNYVNPTNMCIGPTWFLSVDTQLYFLAPIFLFSMCQWPKRTISVMLLLCFVSLGNVFNIYYNMGHAFSGEDHVKIYTSTHGRLTPWMLGGIAGYFTFKKSKKTIKLSKIMVFLLWSFGMACLFSVALWHYLLVHNEITKLHHSVFQACVRAIWSVGIVFVILLCTFGYGGPVNTFLSLHIFTVICNINYNIYLMHSFIIYLARSVILQSYYYSLPYETYVAAADIVQATIVGLICTLAYELPFVRIEQYILSKRLRKPKHQQELVTTEKFNNMVGIENPNEFYKAKNVDL